MATNTSKKQSTESAKPPVAKLRLGLINASIWERVTENGTFHSVTFERRYRDANGDWHSTHSYDAGDLPTLAKLADQAHGDQPSPLRRGRRISGLPRGGLTRRPVNPQLTAVMRPVCRQPAENVIRAEIPALEGALPARLENPDY